ARSTAGCTVAVPTIDEIPVLTALMAVSVAVTETGPAGAVSGTVPFTEAVTDAPGARVNAFQVSAAAGATARARTAPVATAAGATSPTLGDNTSPGSAAESM